MGQPPLISLSGLHSEDPDQHQRLCDQIGAAARQIGFLRICDHGIDLKLIEATYAAAERFFAMPEDFKRRYYIGNSSNHRGYVPFTEKGDYPDEVSRNYEAFDLGLDLPCNDPHYLSGNRLLGPNVWPEMSEFRDTVSEYYRQISSLGRRLCACLEVHLDLPTGSITSQMSKPISQLRLLHYVRKSDLRDHRSVNMGAHTDYECLTLLHTRNKGLQVMTQDDRWVDVPVDPCTFIVNIGDMLEAWTNGLLRSTPHRVLNLSPERFSMPYFVAADYDAEIKPFPELLQSGAAPQYDPFLAGEHLERMLIRDFPYLRHRKDRRISVTSARGPAQPMVNPFETRLNARAS
jgi:isopenicillin N synthase-like dioxygenase